MAEELNLITLEPMRLYQLQYIFLEYRISSQSKKEQIEDCRKIPSSKSMSKCWIPYLIWIRIKMAYFEKGMIKNWLKLIF